MQVLDEEQTVDLLRDLGGTRLYLPVLLAVTTGMRRGEILGLHWREIDLGAGTVAVVQSLQNTRRGLVFREPKTSRSRRVVRLPQMTVDALRKHRKEQNELRLSLGNTYHDDDLVIADIAGRPWHPQAFSGACRLRFQRLGVMIRFHDLRHTHATQLLRQGIHPKVVSERLGHASIGITMDTYSHVLPDMQEEAAERIDAVLRAANA
jgi:integrase